MSRSSRLTLAQQLKQLESDSPAAALDPEFAYASLDSLASSEGKDVGREHYLDVGTSKLRRDSHPAAHTLLNQKYAGIRKGRMKIFDDDDDEEDSDELEKNENQDEEAEGSDPSDGDGDGGTQEGESDRGSERTDDEEEEEEEEEDIAENEDNGEDDDGRQDEDEDEEESQPPQREGVVGRGPVDAARQGLDPIASLRQSRMKDIEKGQGIKRQKASQVSVLVLL